MSSTIDYSARNRHRRHRLKTLRDQRKQEVHMDFPKPVGNEAKTSEPCKTYFIADDWASLSLEMEKASQPRRNASSNSASLKE